MPVLHPRETSDSVTIEYEIARLSFIFCACVSEIEQLLMITRIFNKTHQRHFNHKENNRYNKLIFQFFCFCFRILLPIGPWSQNTMNCLNLVITMVRSMPFLNNYLCLNFIFINTQYAFKCPFLEILSHKRCWSKCKQRAGWYSQYRYWYTSL